MFHQFNILLNVLHPNLLISGEKNIKLLMQKNKKRRQSESQCFKISTDGSIGHITQNKLKMKKITVISCEVFYATNLSRMYIIHRDKCYELQGQSTFSSPGIIMYYISHEII